MPTIDHACLPVGVLAFGILHAAMSYVQTRGGGSSGYRALLASVAIADCCLHYEIV